MSRMSRYNIPTNLTEFAEGELIDRGLFESLYRAGPWGPHMTLWPEKDPLRPITLKDGGKRLNLGGPEATLHSRTQTLLTGDNAVAYHAMFLLNGRNHFVLATGFYTDDEKDHLRESTRWSFGPEGESTDSFGFVTRHKPASPQAWRMAFSGGLFRTHKSVIDFLTESPEGTSSQSVLDLFSNPLVFLLLTQPSPLPTPLHNTHTHAHKFTGRKLVKEVWNTMVAEHKADKKKRAQEESEEEGESEEVMAFEEEEEGGEGDSAGGAGGWEEGPNLIKPALPQLWGAGRAAQCTDQATGMPAATWSPTLNCSPMA